MNLERYEFSITKASNNEYILNVKGINYLVGEIVFILLNGFKTGQNYESIVNSITENTEYKELQKNDIDQLIQNEIIPLLEAEDVEKKKNPVKSLFILLKPYKYPVLVHAFNFLFSPVLFWISFIGMAAYSCYFLLNNNASYNLLSDLKYGWILTFLFTYFAVFFHELGHVVAASRFKIIAKEIGFGFYFIYPALYTDLTEIWKLHKKHRIIINLAGMYFQMILNIVLIALILILPEYKTLFTSFFLSNMALVFFNFNPLFKFDAYWIFSDFFEIHNLRDQSNKVLLSFIKKAEFPKLELKKQIPLTVYSISYLLFMVLIWSYIGRYFYKSTVDLYNLYMLSKFSTFGDFDTIKKIVGFGFTLFLVIRILISVVDLKKSIVKKAA